MGKTCIIAKFHKTDLAICSHSRKKKTLSDSRRNTVKRVIHLQHSIERHNTAFCRGAMVAQLVKPRSTDLAVPGSRPAVCGNLFNHKQGSIAHSLSF